MAIIVKKGALGTLSGKIGGVVATKWLDIDVGKKTPTKKKKKKGQPKSDQSERLGMMTHFLSPFKKPIRIGFKKKKSKNPPFQTAVEHNLTHAVIGEYPKYKIDCSKIAFSKGSLDMAWGARFELTGTCDYYVKWEVPETSNIRITGSDSVFLLIYSENKGQLLNLGNKIHTRAELEIRDSFADIFHGHILHAWIFFSSKDGNANSRTRYIGAVQVPEKEEQKPSEEEALPA